MKISNVASVSALATAASIGAGTDAATADGAAGSVQSKLRRVDVAVSSRLASIKAIYRGTIAVGGGNTGAVVSATATITAVVTANALIFFLGSTTPGATTTDSRTRVELTNGTTVTAYAFDHTAVETVGYEVVEYN